MQTRMTQGTTGPNGLAPLGVLLGFAAAAASCDVVLGIHEVGMTTDALGGGGAAGAGGQGGSIPMGTSCEDAIPIVASGWIPKPIVILGETSGPGASTSGSFQHCPAGDGPERVYVFMAPMKERGILTVSLSVDAEFDAVLYARKGMCTVESFYDCSDMGTGIKGGEVLSFPVESDELVYLFVDGKTAEDAGKYTMTVSYVSGTSCSMPVPVTIGTPIDTSVTLRGFLPGSIEINGECGSCMGDLCFNGKSSVYGQNVIYAIKAPNAAHLEAHVAVAGQVIDTALYARPDCSKPTEFGMGCKDDDAKSGETITLPGSEGSLFVGRHASDVSGSYALTLTVK